MTTQPKWKGKNQRRSGVWPFIRKVFDLGIAISKSEHPVGAVICTVWGHARATEIPGSLRSDYARRTNQREYKCPRCEMQMGFRTGGGE